MFKRVDLVQDDTLEGFEYRNKDGESEYVKIDVRDCTAVSIQDSEGYQVTVYTEDIQKLIAALKAAEQYWKGQE